MYRGYKIKPVEFEDLESLVSIGQGIYKKNTEVAKYALDSFILSDNSLDGTKISEKWFPKVEADVFISHSHNDETFAIALAGWLFANFKIKSFIDSCIWGYSNELLRNIDNEYCFNPITHLYDYKQRNYSTSHVHMMLSTALAFMIDKAECLIFLDTNNSIKPFKDTDRTKSPWIYFEVVLSKLIRQRIPDRIKLVLEEKYFSADGTKEISKGVDFSYEVDLCNLVHIDHNTLNNWQRIPNLNSAEIALDKLYSIAPPLSYSNSLHG